MIKTYLTDGTVINNTTIEQLRNNIAMMQTCLPAKSTKMKLDPLKKVEIKLRQDVIPNIEIRDLENIEFFEDKEILSMQERLEIDKIKRTTESDMEKYK